MSQSNKDTTQSDSDGESPIKESWKYLLATLPYIAVVLLLTLAGKYLWKRYFG